MRCTEPVGFTAEWTADRAAAVLRRVADLPLDQADLRQGWSLGCDAGYLAALREHWLHDYDLDAATARLNRYPQFTVSIDGVPVHYVHVRGEGRLRRPLLLTHGWPGTHLEFWPVVEALAFPSRVGGRVEEAFDVVIPSLPGFGFSGAPGRPTGPRATSGLWDALMRDVLGYDSYLAHGGDWGAVVTSWLARLHPEHVRSVHLTMAPLHAAAPPKDEVEQDWLRAVRRSSQSLSGYSALQTTKPQSLAWVTAGNPLGQAAWIVERYHDWSDLGDRPFEEVHPLQSLLDAVMVYVMTGAFPTSVLYYHWFSQEPSLRLAPGERCETPTAYAAFPGDALLPPPPRTRVELAYDVIRWSDMPRGGHFPALEVPGELVADLRAWGAEVWPG